jgi:hypothetical protein
VLKHGSYHEAKGLGVDESVMWGDYFLLDAIHSVTSSIHPVQIAAPLVAAERSTS